MELVFVPSSGYNYAEDDLNDSAYEVTEVVNGYAVRAMRAAVLAPLLPSAVYKKHDIPDMLQRVRKQWHARLVALRKAGWDPLTDETNFQYMRNCPPFGVKTVSVGRHCGRKFCPFCWARRMASPLYARLEAVFRQPDGFMDASRCLIECDRTFRFKWDQPQAAWPNLKDRVRRGRRREVVSTFFPGQGSHVLQTLEPYERELVFRRRSLIVVPANDATEYVKGEADVNHSGGGTLVWDAHEFLKLSELVKIVGRVAKYPTGLMRCPPDKLIDYIHQTDNLRLATSYGCLRQSKNQI